jgi:hypothetical protein
LRGESPEPDAEAWFVRTFGEQPSYSRLLDELGKTPSERQAVLKSYIEPTPEEREEGKKLPTDAHRAIAGLVASGHIRVILTTNFDRLMESALEAAGVAPTVIASPDAVHGATPLIHAPCTVVKLHGDYLDTRIKNTPAELEAYDVAVNRLLDQVFDEFGLIVCGWSGDWDTALRAAIERCPNRRYATYWAARGEPSQRAKDLVQRRQAQLITIDGADGFFPKLAQKVEALEEYQRPHPLSSAMAVAALKRYIPDPRHRVRLGELLNGEADNLVSRVKDKESFPDDIQSPEALWERMQKLEALSETMMALVAAGCYWGEDTQDALWAQAVQRVARAGERRIHGYYRVWDRLTHYPVLLCTYAGGLAALANGRLRSLKHLLVDVEVPYLNGLTQPSACGLDPYRVIQEDNAKRLPGLQNRRTPVNDHLFTVLTPLMQVYVPSESQYEQLFDRFEYLRALVAYDLCGESSVGQFAWRCWSANRDIRKKIADEYEESGKDWAPLRAGLFRGSFERFIKAQKQLTERIESLSWM